ncbi:hypothetical protein PWW31_20435 [Vibrio harveyi]|nr:hypothetical protein PWW31_20435 [Vibrio harveyi]
MSTIANKRVLYCGLPLLLLSFGVIANPIPSVSNPSGTDRIRTSEGATCEQAVSTK